MGKRLLLDKLNGFEFEELVADIFRKKGYKKVRVSPCTGDEGRDILMEEEDEQNGTIPVVVECKHHKSNIGRPVVQKLHSAVITLEGSGLKKGIVVTSGFFSPQAIEYVRKINQQSDDLKIELIDGRELKEQGVEVGVDFKSGTIQAITDESLPFSNKEDSENSTIERYFNQINGIDQSILKFNSTKIDFQPAHYMKFNIFSEFRTTVGLIHRIDEDVHLLIDGKSGRLLKDDLMEPLLSGIGDAFSIENNAQVTTEKEEFLLNESELKQKAISEIIDSHTADISYTGRNNVSYTKRCVPKAKDITIYESKPLYYPQWNFQINAVSKNYGISVIEAPNTKITLKNDAEICQVCNKNVTENLLFKSRWFCRKCGSITCRGHRKIGRLSDVPICRNCVISRRFMGASKHFESQEELNEFEEFYNSLPLYKKIMENKVMVYSTAISIIILIVQL